MGNIEALKHTGSMYLDYNNNFSIVLMARKAVHKFTHVNIGDAGSTVFQGKPGFHDFTADVPYNASICKREIRFGKKSILRRPSL